MYADAKLNLLWGEVEYVLAILTKLFYICQREVRKVYQTLLDEDVNNLMDGCFHQSM